MLSKDKQKHRKIQDKGMGYVRPQKAKTGWELAVLA